MPCERAGLTSAEAARRLAAEGPNLLPQAKRRTALRIVGEVLRELMFFALIAAILALIFVNRSFSPSLAVALGKRNGALAWVLTAVATVSAPILLVRPVRDFLKFGPLHLADCAIVAAVGIGLLVALEWLKPLAARDPHANHRHAYA